MSEEYQYVQVDDPTNEERLHSEGISPIRHEDEFDASLRDQQQ